MKIVSKIQKLTKEEFLDQKLIPVIETFHFELPLLGFDLFEKNNITDIVINKNIIFNLNDIQPEELLFLNSSLRSMILNDSQSDDIDSCFLSERDAYSDFKKTIINELECTYQNYLAYYNKKGFCDKLLNMLYSLMSNIESYEHSMIKKKDVIDKLKSMSDDEFKSYFNFIEFCNYVKDKLYALPEPHFLEAKMFYIADEFGIKKANLRFSSVDFGFSNNKEIQSLHFYFSLDLINENGDVEKTESLVGKLVDSEYVLDLKNKRVKFFNKKQSAYAYFMKKTNENIKYSKQLLKNEDY